MIIALDSVAKTFGERTLFENVSVQVNPGDRYALVGPNGAGKTTLLEIMAGVQSPDAGSVRKAKRATVGYLPQEAIEMRGASVLDEVLSSAEELRAASRRLEELAGLIAAEEDAGRRDALLAEYGASQSEFEAKGGYTLEVEARTVLTGLGFAETDLARPTDEFSGGWLMRIALAKLLVLRPDVLLLDEPTNHLDLESVVWLESFLRAHEGAIVLVSHDRAFMEGLIDHVIEVELGRTAVYTGSYSEFVHQREISLRNLRLAYDRQQREIAHMQQFVDRFRYKESKARQAQERLKRIREMDRIELPEHRKTVKFAFPQPVRTGERVISLQGVRKAYGSNVVYDALDLTLYRGDKIALVGPNGAGKSTLLKLLAGAIEPDAGERALGQNASVAYFAQHQLEALSARRTVLSELDSVAPDWTQGEARKLLGAFLFSGDDVNKKVSVLSGGERCRLALAKMLAEPAPLLCLDEPTNHLDVDSSDVLEQALAAFDGTLVLITHDRHLIRSVANRIIDVRDGSVTTYDGDYDYYVWKRERLEDAELDRKDQHDSGATVPSSEKTARKTREQKRQEAEERNRRHRRTKEERARIAVVETELEAARARHDELVALLGDSETYEDGEGFAEAIDEYARVNKSVARLEEEWLVLAEHLEAETED